GSDLQRVADGLVERRAATDMDRHLDGLQRDVPPASVAEDRLDARRIGERKGSGATLAQHVWHRRRWQKMHNSLEGPGGPGVLLECLPANETEPAGGSGRRTQVPEGRARVVEEHDAEAREDDVEGRRLERM